jgi:DNA segregation ATPase FtsK/SpoIIIE-like protein
MATPPVTDPTDPLLPKARMIVVAHKRASISLVQRHLMIGYFRATVLLDTLQAQGVVSDWHAGEFGTYRTVLVTE